MPRPRRGRQATPSRGASNIELSDREMLANIRDVIKTSADGWATTTEIAIKCGFTGNGKKSHTPATKVASRLSWMRAGGLLESTDPEPAAPYFEPGSKDTRWRMTAIGEEILGGALSRSLEGQIERLDAGAIILMQRQLALRGWVQGEDAVAFALKRQYVNVLAQRPRHFRMTKR